VTLMPDRMLGSQLEYAQALVDRDDHAKATEVCRHILAAFPRCAGAYGILAEATLLGGQPARAEELWARVLSVDPQSTGAALGMALVQEGRGQRQRALGWLERAWECAAEGDRDTHVALWSRAEMIGYVPALSLSRAGLANTMLRAGMFSQACSELKAALTEAPERDDLNVGLAVASYRSGDIPTAQAICSVLLERLPDCLKALLIAGQLGLGTEVDAWARQALRRAQTLDPQNQVAQSLFGEGSPLPPRAARLPFGGPDDTLALTFPDMLDGGYDDEGDEEGMPPRLDSIL